MKSTVATILQNFQSSHPAVVGLLGAAEEVKANFVARDDNAWRSLVSPSVQERLWQAIPREAIDLLQLCP
jgi:hypothetical protein